MIQINLSEEQAKKLLNATGWGEKIPRDVERELFRQLEHKLTPASTEAASLAVWRHEHGYTAGAIKEWKRNNETAESAFANYVDSVSNQVMEKYK